MNILYLLKILDTTKLSHVVEVLDLPPLDMNLILWEAEENGDIEVNRDKDRIKALKEVEGTWHNPELANKLIRTIQHYAKTETNITAGRLNTQIKNPSTGQGYLVHEYLMTMQYLIDSGQIVEETVSVPKTPKRPYHKFIFLCLPENGDENQEWNAKVVNKWIADWEKSKVK